jgi:hypothetical protein
MITTNGNFSCSTNALESINRQLKIATGAGFLNLYKSCRVLRDFKINYLLLHEDRRQEKVLSGVLQFKFDMK